MEISDALDFLRDHHRCVLATTRADGHPQLAPVAAGVDGDGLVVVSTRQGSARVANLRQRPYASLLCMSDGFYGEWVQVEGPVQIVELPEAMDGLIAYYQSLSGEHPDWDDYRRAMVEEGRVLLRLTVERAGPGGH